MALKLTNMKFPFFFPVLSICKSKCTEVKMAFEPLTIYKDGQHEGSSNLKPKHLDCAVVVGYSILGK